MRQRERQTYRHADIEAVRGYCIVKRPVREEHGVGSGSRKSPERARAREAEGHCKVKVNNRRKVPVPAR